MKTEVTMVRFLDDYEIRQKSKSKLFNATDLIKIINGKRVRNEMGPVSLSNYLAAKPTHEFLDELSTQKNIPKNKLVNCKKKAGTWVHPYVLMDIALWSYPKLKVKIYDWIYDELIKNRNISGTTFNTMNKILDANFNIGAKYWVYADIANSIADTIGLADVDNKWQIATKEQLKLRILLQKEIIASAEYGTYKNVTACVEKAVVNFKKKYV